MSVTEQTLIDLFGAVETRSRGPATLAGIHFGVAQDGSDTTGPWIVLHLDGGVVYANRRAEGVTWNRGDRVVLARGGVSYAIIARLVATTTGTGDNGDNGNGNGG